MHGKHVIPTNVRWILLSIAFAFPWLIPAHEVPWTTFYTEIASISACLFLAILLFFASCRSFLISPLAAGFLFATGVILIQSAAGIFIWAEEAYVVACFPLAVTIAITVGRACETSAPGKLTNTLLGGLAIAAYASTCIALAQSLVVFDSALVLSPGLGARAIANIGQPNNLATLLSWGLIATWWGFVTHFASGRVAYVGASFLLLGIVATQSRVGVLQVIFLTAAAVAMSRRTFPELGRRLPYFLLLTGFIILAAAWSRFAQLMNATAINPLERQVSAGTRPIIWKMNVEGILDRPWLGYGWDQGRQVQLSLLDRYGHLQEEVQHAHNFVLDLMVWNGVPLGILFSFGLVCWGLWHWTKAQNAAQKLLLLALGAFMLHAFVELPHCYLFFLLPAGLMVGVIESQIGTRPLLRLPAYIVAAIIAASFAITVQVTKEYSQILDSLRAERLRAANIYGASSYVQPKIYVLSGLQSALSALRTTARPEMSANELARFRQVLARYPSASGLTAYAQAAALNGAPYEAEFALRRICQLPFPERCAAAKVQWDEFRKMTPSAAPVEFPSQLSP